MATYKVIQDIEADDKLIGWMSPRQAIYAAIVIVSGFIAFMLASKGVWWLSIPLLPHMVLFTVLAGPFVHDQPSEIWLLARIQFSLKPRRRIWDQSGLKELVTITVPKKIERHLTDGLSQNEVRSRLKALANTIDSRGWAIKNVESSMYMQPAYANASSDRLIDTSSLPQEVPSYEVYAGDDMLDEANNPTAQYMQQMINQSSQTHRQQLMTQMQQPQTAVPQPAQNNYWFVDPATQGASAAPAVSDQKELLDRLHAEQEKDKSLSQNSHLKRISPLSEKSNSIKPAATPATVAQQPVIDPVVVGQLAQNNDLNVATIARQANKPKENDELGDNEVVISLH